MKTFSFRSFTSFILAWTFLALLLSGSVLFVSPPGRVANWTDWRLLFLTKMQWTAVHTLMAAIFLIGGFFHLLKFNWRIFYAYLMKKREATLQFKREMVLSGLVFLLVLAGTLLRLPPFQTLVSYGELAKNSWENAAQAAPVAHMEEMDIKQVAERLQVPPDKILNLLQQQGMPVERAELSLASVAKRYNLSPQQVYSIIQKALSPSPSAEGHVPAAGGAGLGAKTIQGIAAELGLKTEDAIELLRAKKLQAKPEDTIRTVAVSAGMRPFEVVEILKQGHSENQGNSTPQNR
jgi:hypothetical protein